MLYSKFYKRLEGVRWNMERDVPWQEIEQNKLTEADLQLVKSNALIEWTAVDATEAFLRDFSFEPDFTSFVSVWFYEEMKHFLVLKRYLEAFGIEVTPQECSKMRKVVKPASPFNILTVHFIGEFRLASWYSSLKKVFNEPVLKQIYGLISADEIRHGVCYFNYLKSLLSKERKEIVTVLKTALFMLRQPVHPTILTDVVANLEGSEKVYEYLGKILDKEEEDAAKERVFAYLSKLCATPLTEIHDILAQLKVVRAEFKPA